MAAKNARRNCLFLPARRYTHRRFEIWRNEFGEMKRNALSMPLSDPWVRSLILPYIAGMHWDLTAVWQLSGGKRRTPDMRYRAYKPRTRSTLLITRCIMAKFRYFKKAQFHYFKQVVNLSATCFHVELEQFLACFRVARVCQRQLGFQVSVKIGEKIKISHKNATEILLSVLKM